MKGRVQRGEILQRWETEGEAETKGEGGGVGLLIQNIEEVQSQACISVAPTTGDAAPLELTPCS